MKTSIIEVGGLVSALSARGIETQLSKLIGVKKAEVNYVAGSATVVYDETAIDLKAIKARVQECGYHCAGELLPKHVCVSDDPPDATVAGEPQVVEVVASSNSDQDAVLGLAATVEQGSDHPLAQAILRRAERLKLALTGFTNIEGKGARAEVAGKTLLLGNRRLMDEESVDMAGLVEQAARQQDSGQTVVHVAQGGKLVGLSAIADAPRPTAAAMVKKMHERGVEVAMSGSSALVAVNALLLKRTRLDGIHAFRSESVKASDVGGHR